MLESVNPHTSVNRQASLIFATYFQTFSKTIFPCLKGSLSTTVLTNAFHTILECQILLQTAAHHNTAALAIARNERQLARRILVSNWIYLYHYLICYYLEMAYTGAWEPSYNPGPKALPTTMCTSLSHGC